MALSNWDCLAVDKDGNPTNGIIESPLGVKVEVYKNWLYVHDIKAWRKGGQFVSDTVMEVQEGDFQYLDTHIVAVRGPQDGVFAVVWIGSEYQPSDLMVCCGVCGYNENQWVGVTGESKKFLADFLKLKRDEYDRFSKKIREVDLSKALRFNQGDAYFMQQLGHKTPATEIGQAEEPMIMKMLGKDDESPK